MSDVSALETEYARRVVLAALDLLQALEEMDADWGWHEGKPSEVSEAQGRLRAVVDESKPQ
jgi:hypothetical protein